MNIFKYEFRQNQKAMIGWILGIAGAGCLFMSFLPMFMEEGEALAGFMEGLGDMFTTAVGIDMEVFFGPVGFYTYVFMYVLLIGAVQAMAMGLNMLSKEIRMKTADFLMTKPSSRARIFWSKTAAAVTVLVITQICYYMLTGTVAYFAAGRELDLKPFMLVSVTLMFVQFIFLAMGILVSQVIGKIKAPIPMSIGAVFFFFILGMLSSLMDKELIRYLTPMKYFDTSYIIREHRYESTFVTLSIILTIMFGTGGYILFRKKDVPSV